MITLHLGDCLDFMRTMDAGSVDAVITDPGYSLNKCPCCDCEEMTLTPSTIAPFIAERTGRGRRCNSAECSNCGAIFLDVRYTDEEMGKIYNGYRDEAYVRRRIELEPDYKDYAAWFVHQVPYMKEIEEMITPYVSLPVTILDWGGDSGINTPFRGNRTLHIYDIGDAPLVDGERVDNPTGVYDLIVCANVLEHVSDPRGVLQGLTKFMDAHSVLYLEIPFEPLLAYADPASIIEEWHEHVNYFLPKSISIMFDKCGLELKEVNQVIAQVADFSIMQYLMIAKLYEAD